MKSDKPCVLTQMQVNDFLKALEDVSIREAAIAYIITITARGVSEVLKCRLSDFNSHKSTLFDIEIGYQLGVVINKYLDKRILEPTDESEYMFITKTGRPVYRTQVKKNFDIASKACDFGFIVTSPMLQWSSVRFWLEHLSKDEVLERIRPKKIPRLLEYVSFGK